MRDHKSLLAWQRAHFVVRSVLGVCRHQWKPWSAAVLNQLQRASLSVQLNIAEGHAFRSRARFRNHLLIAYASAVETVELLELTIDEGVVKKQSGTLILASAVEARALLLGLLRRYGAPTPEQEKKVD